MPQSGAPQWLITWTLPAVVSYNKYNWPPITYVIGTDAVVLDYPKQHNKICTHMCVELVQTGRVMCIIERRVFEYIENIDGDDLKRN